MLLPLPEEAVAFWPVRDEDVEACGAARTKEHTHNADRRSTKGKKVIVASGFPARCGAVFPGVKRAEGAEGRPCRPAAFIRRGIPVCGVVLRKLADR